MSAFLIVHSKLTEPELFQKYVEAAGDSIDQYNGKYLLGGLATDVLEGSHDKDRTVIFEFPDKEHAKNWYNSDEYKSVKHLRDNTGSFDFLLVDSF